MSVLLVTGGSRGIGAAICRQAAAEGWAVAVNYASSSDEADGVVSDIEAAGGKAVAVQADVADAAQVEAMFKRVDEELGPVTGLVNNAGINGKTGPVDEMDAEMTMRLFAVNAVGPFICAGAAVRRMAKKHGGNGGVIVNISSAASRHGAPTYIDYGAAKGAVDTFTIGLAKEQAEQGIRVNCVRPGATMTELSVVWSQENPDWLPWVMDQVPLKRPGEMAEIANAVIYMLSDKSSYSTGAILDVCGGWVSP